MAEAVLIATSVVFGILIMIAAFYFLVYYQHPDDKWVAWFPKVVVVLGLSLACFNIFLLPLDVSNYLLSTNIQNIANTFGNSTKTNGTTFSLLAQYYRNSQINNTSPKTLLYHNKYREKDQRCGQSLMKKFSPYIPHGFGNVVSNSPPTMGELSVDISSVGGIPMTDITLGFAIATACLFIIVVPFTIFYYEGGENPDTEEEQSNPVAQTMYALKWCIPIIGVVIIVIYVLQRFFGQANISYTALQSPLVPITSTSTQMNYFCSMGNASLCNQSFKTASIDVSPIVYTLAIVLLFACLLFCCFSGVGVVSLPFDLIIGFQKRPRPIKYADYVEKKRLIGQQAAALLRLGENLVQEIKAKKSGWFSNNRELKRKESTFKREALLLEYQYQMLEISYKERGGNPIVQYFFLLAGLIGAVVSIIWIVHIGIYLVPVTLGFPALDPFLNAFMIGFGQIPFIGIFFYALFSFYLLATVVKGNIKVGMRILFVTMHPMKMGDTLMSSLVFNTGLILVCSLAVTQFCSMAFMEYAANTASFLIFSVQIRNLVGLGYVYQYFVFGWLGVVVITFFYSLYRPYKVRNGVPLLY